jgi:hypothetical protein
VLKADALKYVAAFRNMVSTEMWYKTVYKEQVITSLEFIDGFPSAIS